MKRVLVTGPSERRSDYVRAALEAQWTAIDFPLVDVVRKDVAPLDVLGAEPAVDWICVTSANALPFIELTLAAFPQLAHVTAAAVGDRTTTELARIGCAIAFEGSADAKELADRVLSRATPASRVLWPHGDRSDEFAHRLRSRGVTVVDPIVYETRSREDREIPEAEAVFFASPSAVTAWHELPGHDAGPRLAIAIGATTMSALHAETDARFERLMTLAAPTPEAFADALAHVDPDL